MILIPFILCTDDTLSVSTSTLPTAAQYEAGTGAFRINYTLSNGENAIIRVWSNFESGHGLIPVEVYSSSLTCVFAYSCQSGNCTRAIGSSLCASYTVLEPPSNCTTPGETCPQKTTYCNTQCDSRSTSATCNSSLCTDSQCTVPSMSVRCQCGSISGAYRTVVTTGTIIGAVLTTMIAFMASSL
jgi:hypothetical protein